MPTSIAPTNLNDLSTVINDNYPDETVNNPGNIGAGQRSALGFLKQSLSFGTSVTPVGASITIPNDGSSFTVLSNSPFSTIAPSWQGRVVRLSFSANNIITASSTISLGGLAAYQTVANEILQFMYVGTVWRLMAAPKQIGGTALWAGTLAGANLPLALSSSTLDSGLSVNGNAVRFNTAGTYEIGCVAGNTLKPVGLSGYFGIQMLLNGSVVETFAAYSEAAGTNVNLGILCGRREFVITANQDLTFTAFNYGQAGAVAISIQIRKIPN